MHGLVGVGGVKKLVSRAARYGFYTWFVSEEGKQINSLISLLQIACSRSVDSHGISCFKSTFFRGH